jgi:hypothetical protein
MICIFSVIALYHRKLYFAFCKRGKIPSPRQQLFLNIEFYFSWLVFVLPLSYFEFQKPGFISKIFTSHLISDQNILISVAIFFALSVPIFYYSHYTFIKAIKQRTAFSNQQLKKRELLLSAPAAIFILILLTLTIFRK